MNRKLGYIAAAFLLIGGIIALNGQSTLSLGSATATTQSAADNSTKVATTAYADNAATSSASISNGYLTISGTKYCGGFIQCTIPSSSGWSWNGTQGSSTATGGDTAPLFISWALTSATSIRTYTRSASGSFTVIVAMQMNTSSLSNGDSSNDVCLTDGTKYILFGVTDLTAQVTNVTAAQLHIQKWTDTTTVSTSYTNWSTIGETSWYRTNWWKVVVDGTNITWSVSSDGINYVQINQQAKGDFLGTISGAGICSYAKNPSQVTIWSYSQS